MSLIDKINEIRNTVVTNMSKVEEEKDDGTRVIRNGKDMYSVKKTKNFERRHFGFGDPRVYFPATVNVDSICYSVKDSSGNSQAVIIEKRKIVIEGDGRVSPCVINLEGRGGFGLELNAATDINDINNIRYQLGKYQQKKAEQLAHFIDKFVIVTPEERKAYKSYESKLDALEKEADREKARQAKRAAEESTRAAKESERTARAAEKNRVIAEKLRSKVEEKFIGK